MNTNKKNHSAQITTQVSTRYAGFWRRFLARVIDFGIIALMGIVVQSMLGQSPSFGITEIMNAQSIEELEQLRTTFSSSVSTLILLAFDLLYYLIFWVNYNGATPGKRLMAIRATKDDGGKLTYPIAFIRYIGTFISAVSLGLGYLWAIWDKRKQAWHDKIAKTIVVKTDSKPKTVLAIFLSLITILLYSFYMGVNIYRGYELGMQEIEQREKDSYTSRSYVKSKEEMSPEAKIHYERSQELFGQMRQNSSNLEMVRQLNDENIQELQEALEIQPDNPMIWLDLGNAYTWISSEGSLEDGLEALKKAEELDPNNVVYINNVGDMLIRMKRYEDAILQFQKALRITDSSGFTHLSIGIAYKNLGIDDSAREHLQKAVDLFEPKNNEGQYDNEILLAKKQMAGLAQ